MTRNRVPSNLSIAAVDGFSLAASLWNEDSASPTLVLSGATGVSRRFYTDFAAFLAAAGYRVLTFDFRGIGDSRPRSLRGFAASMRNWGELDLAGVLGWCADRHPRAPLLLVGHSAGGQMGAGAGVDRKTAQRASLLACPSHQRSMQSAANGWRY